MFGDIATSPLYTVGTVFQRLTGEKVVPTPNDIRGALCVIVWTLSGVVTIKYMMIMALASFHGEGGTFSLLSCIKASGALRSRKMLWHALIVVSALASSLIIADGVLTPVVTVQSAVEGIGLAVWRFNGDTGTRSIDTGTPGYPSNYGRTATLAAAVLVAIFALQRFGSQHIGLLYSPVVRPAP